jgi:hypothetical protein
MLMDDDPESFETFLARVVRRLVERLAADPRITHSGVLEGFDRTTAERERSIQLSNIRMAVQVRKALDEHLGNLIAYGSDGGKTFLYEMMNEPRTKATWKEIGDALGVSAQAAHHKYGRWPRGRR